MSQVSDPPSFLSGKGRLFLLAPLCALLPACSLGSQLDNAEKQNALRNNCIDSLFESSCGGAGCHGPEEGNISIDLESPGVEQRLLNQPASYAGAMGCPDPPQLLVDSASPSESLMLLKVENRQSCGDHMPPFSLAGQPRLLSDEDYACLSNWVWALAATQDEFGRSE